MLVPQEQTGGKQGPEWKEWVREPGLTPAEKLGPRNGRRHVVGGGGESCERPGRSQEELGWRGRGRQEHSGPLTKEGGRRGLEGAPVS